MHFNGIFCLITQLGGGQLKNLLNVHFISQETLNDFIVSNVSQCHSVEISGIRSHAFLAKIS